MSTEPTFETNLDGNPDRNPDDTMGSAAELTAAPSQRRALRRVWPVLRPHRWRLIAAALVSLVATGAALALPVLAGFAVDAVIDGDRDRLRVVAGTLAALALVQFGLERARLLLAAGAAERVLLDLRERVAAALLTRPPAFFDRHSPGELVARGTGDVAALSGFVRGGLRSLLDALLLIAVTFVVLAATSWPLALIALVAMAPAIVAVRRFHRDSTIAYARYTQGEAAVSATVAELVDARETVAAAGAQQVMLTRAAGADAEMLAANDAALRAENRLSALEFYQLAALAAVVLAGGALVEAGRAEVGVIATFLLALRQLFDPIASLGWLYGEAQQARANLARLLQLLELPAPVRGSAEPGAGDLELDGVSFAYTPGSPVLRDVTLTLPAGAQVALVGPTGAGKSTLAKLAAGLLTPDSGRVTLGGVDLAAAAPDRLRRRIVMLPQEGFVLAGTLAENLRLVPGEHTDADLRAAITAAGLEGWLARLPAGLHTELDGRGANLSAGERQLVALARAALADPDVLILDEATADIDPATDALVTAALARLGTGRTLIVIAHRPATAARFPRVITVEGATVRASSAR